jgi:hypothetical protein
MWIHHPNAVDESIEAVDVPWELLLLPLPLD